MLSTSLLRTNVIFSIYILVVSFLSIVLGERFLGSASFVFTPIFITFPSAIIAWVLTRGYRNDISPRQSNVPFKILFFSSLFVAPFILFLADSFSMIVIGSPVLIYNQMNLTLYAFVGLVILAPISEEFFFRGVLFKLLGKHQPTVKIIVTSFFFALLHMDILNFWAPFLLGFVLGVIRIYTKTIVPSIFCHATYNAMVLYFSARAPFSSIITIIMILFSSMLFALFVLEVLWIKKSSQKSYVNMYTVPLDDRLFTQKENYLKSVIPLIFPVGLYIIISYINFV